MRMWAVSHRQVSVYHPHGKVQGAGQQQQQQRQGTTLLVDFGGEPDTVRLVGKGGLLGAGARTALIDSVAGVRRIDQDTVVVPCDVLPAALQVIFPLSSP